MQKKISKNEAPATKGDIILLKDDLFALIKSDTKATVTAAIDELTLIVSGAFTRMEKNIDERFQKMEDKFDEKFEAIDERFEGVNARINGIYTLFDSHSLECVSGKDFDRLERRVTVLEVD